MGPKRHRRKAAVRRMPIPPRAATTNRTWWHRTRRRATPRRVVFVLAALAALTLFLNSVWTTVSVNAHRAVAVATVLSVRHLRGPDQVDVQFHTPDGHTIGATIDEDGPATGDSIEVEYDSRDPERAIQRSSPDNLLTLTYFGLLSLGFTYCAWTARPHR